MKGSASTREKDFRFYTWALILSWVLVLSFLALSAVFQIKSNTKSMAITEARAHLNRDKALRLWGTMHGGVYVQATERTPPSPYLAHLPERDLTTPSGRELTLMNPAYMLRQVGEHFKSLFGVSGRITSLKPLRPGNAPDEWETKALKALEQGTGEVLEFTDGETGPLLRLIHPLETTEGCLMCHAHQGYKVGDIRGGVSISLPVSGLKKQERRYILYTLFSFSLLMVLGSMGIMAGSRGMLKRIRERDRAQKDLQTLHDRLEQLVEERTVELKTALRNVKTLEGLLPVCSHCKNIRDDKGYWNRIEKYIQEHTDARFSHSICPECMDKYYSEYGD